MANKYFKVTIPTAGSGCPATEKMYAEYLAHLEEVKAEFVMLDKYFKVTIPTPDTDAGSGCPETDKMYEEYLAHLKKVKAEFVMLDKFKRKIVRRNSLWNRFKRFFTT